jgi:TonB family protein
MAFRAPRRFTWLAAMLLSLVWPIATLLAPGPALSSSAPQSSLIPVSAALETVAALPTTVANQSWIITSNTVLLLAWALGSLLLLGGLLRDVRTLRAQRQTWRRRRIDGTVVSVSQSDGPATMVGDASTSIVLPEWVLGFHPSLRTLMLRHEDEHRAARDPAILLLARLAVALFPWNIALAWQSRRLQLALEIDCDARVLRAHPDADRYAKLLLAIAHMRSGTARIPAPSLVENTSQLERRIRAMQKVPVRHRGLVAGSALILSVFSIGVAAEVREPRHVARPGEQVGARDTQSELQAQAQQQQSQQRVEGAYFTYEVDRIARMLRGNVPPVYPSLATVSNQSGRAVIRFVIDENGLPIPRTISVVDSTETAYANAALEAVRRYRFAPAEIGGRPVRMWVDLPFDFRRVSGQSATEVRVGADATLGAVAVEARVPPPPSAGGTFFQFEVERVARLASGNPPPAYPAALVPTGERGRVMVSFVIDTTGKADMSTFKVIQSTNNLFTEEVLRVLPNYNFIPASIGSRKVRMHVNLPFEFVR